MTHAAADQRQCKFVVLYRWRLHEGREQAFVAAWSEVTRHLRETGDSLGSRLHRGNDGLWYSYAQWPNADVRHRAFAAARDLPSRKRMRAAIAETLPEVVLEPVAEFFA